MPLYGLLAGPTIALLQGVETASTPISILKKATKATTLGLTFFLLTTTHSYGINKQDSGSDSSYSKRISQARELLGKHYKKSAVRSGETVASIDGFVERTVDERLPKKYLKHSSAIASTIIYEANFHGFDPIFLAAVIDHESKFDIKSKGLFGEIGLMQIKPSTAKWISKKYGIPYKNGKSLENPVTNIRIGAYYLSMLRDQFENHGRLYISAYNMGPKGVGRAVGKKVIPKDYAKAVMTHYLDMYEELKTASKEKRFNVDGVIALNENEFVPRPQ